MDKQGCTYKMVRRCIASVAVPLLHPGAAADCRKALRAADPAALWSTRSAAHEPCGFQTLNPKP